MDVGFPPEVQCRTDAREKKRQVERLGQCDRPERDVDQVRGWGRAIPPLAVGIPRSFGAGNGPGLSVMWVPRLAAPRYRPLEPLRQPSKLPLIL